MASLNVLNIMLSELFALRQRVRVPEPCLVMDDPAQVRAYLDAGSEQGSLAPIYLFNTTLATALIRTGDLVLDLACGPANQLAQIAAVNPDARFVGVDLSAEMLKKAEAVVTQRGLSNVAFKVSDIAALTWFGDGSVDVVISTLSLHHLPDRQTLGRAFAEVKRVLKPNGRVYLSDLGCLRSESSIAQFAGQYADQQPEVFNLDYLNSLRAAFTVADFRTAIQPLGARVRLFSTFLVPYMIVVKSLASMPLDDVRRRRIELIHSALSAPQQADFRKLRLFFRLGGLAV